ncbi:MAG: hypothetical protein V2A73_13060 [Pseudomonadota bacterium]
MISAAPSVCACAPGKVLIAGEYAILEGAPAVVMAVDRRARARIGVDRGGRARSPFLEAARDAIAARFGHGSAPAARVEEISVDTSELSHAGSKLGLGSSAAVTAAAVALAIGDSSNHDCLDRPLVHEIAHHAHAAAQAPKGARGSGADVAAAVYGGVLRVQRCAAASGSPGKPLAVERLPWPAALEQALVWTGKVAKTPELIARVSTGRHADPAGYARAIAGIESAASRLVAAMGANDVPAVLDAVDQGADALAELAVCSRVPLMPPIYTKAREIARACGGVAKPAGAGGGDLVLVLLDGAAARREFGREAEDAGLTLIAAGLDSLGVCLADDFNNG